MDTSEVLKKVRRIEIKTKRLSDHLFSGEYHSSFKGRGMAFSEVRPYQFGDDVRAIDWNVTARFKEPFIKVFEEERELTLMLVVDISASETFGSGEATKRQILTEISAVLAFSAMGNNDKIGLLLFSDQIELFIPPAKGRKHVLRIIRELIEFEPQGKGTDIGLALGYLTNMMKRKAIVFVLSDFLDDRYNDALKIASKRHDLTGIRIYDQREKELPNIGLLPFLDPETGKEQWVNTSSKAVRKRQKAWFLEREANFEKQFPRAGAGAMSCSVDESYVKKMLGYFKRRSA
jgi:uncharacterized protein (DUF58 family)